MSSSTPKKATAFNPQGKPAMTAKLESRSDWNRRGWMGPSSTHSVVGKKHFVQEEASEGRRSFREPGAFLAGSV